MSLEFLSLNASSVFFTFWFILEFDVTCMQTLFSLSIKSITPTLCVLTFTFLSLYPYISFKIGQNIFSHSVAKSVLPFFDSVFINTSYIDNSKSISFSIMKSGII